MENRKDYRELKQYWGKTCKRCGYTYGHHSCGDNRCPRRKTDASKDRFVTRKFKLR